MRNHLLWACHVWQKINKVTIWERMVELKITRKKRLFLFHFVKLSQCYWFFNKKSSYFLFFSCQSLWHKMHDGCAVSLRVISMHPPRIYVYIPLYNLGDHLYTGSILTLSLSTQIPNKSSENSLSLITSGWKNGF